jgi:uncharacterized OsmC-like protein
MQDDAIREATERAAKVLTQRPAAGQKTARTTVNLKPSLECAIEEGSWKLTAGMSPIYGGNSAGPTPGVLGRAALGSCLAIGYAMWAARMNVPIDALEVVIEADMDSRGELGVSDQVPPGYLAVRYVVTVSSRAPETDVRRVIDTADRYSSYRDVLGRAQDLTRELRIVQPAI